MEKTHNERASQKLELEISKDILKVISLAKMCGFGELFYFLHYLHITRLINHFPNVNEKDHKLLSIYRNHLNDSYKYIIQILYTYSKKDFVKPPIINAEIPILLNELVLSMNSKYESLSLLTLFTDVQVSGERDRYLRIDMSNVIDNETLNKYFHYCYRVDRANDFDKDDLKIKEDFLENFKNDYLPFADIFEQEFQISLNQFIDLITYILDKTISQLNEDQLVKLPDGKIDVQALGSILEFGKALVIDKKKVLEIFGDKAEIILARLYFDSSKFDPKQLRYNLIARQPILNYGNRIIVSPELLLDSLFINSHYSLLEAGKHKEEYKKRDSIFFVDKIVKIAEKYGFSEVERELELYEGKNQIGDIDLILKNNKNEFLLIEAKNHSTPLDVFFHDFPATEKRLEYLKKEWEIKVQRRIDHLKIRSNDYNIPVNHKYLMFQNLQKYYLTFLTFLLFLNLNLISG